MGKRRNQAPMSLHRNPKSFHDLPGEIRARIFDMCLPSTGDPALQLGSPDWPKPAVKNAKKSQIRNLKGSKDALTESSASLDHSTGPRHAVNSWFKEDWKENENIPLARLQTHSGTFTRPAFLSYCRPSTIVLAFQNCLWKPGKS